ncbi:hypothetical protein ACLI4R_03465 [Natrialbaceae archaeon A-chndr2]|uniref:hypothetical protein n=1 Tax=Natronosalvus amylolyticus TaxID=2961994 RepID=UPI0020C9ACB9|nr:hypothetical protein [Natronosalvus amylolyticus]
MSEAPTPSATPVALVTLIVVTGLTLGGMAVLLTPDVGPSLFGPGEDSSVDDDRSALYQWAASQFVDDGTNPQTPQNTSDTGSSDEETETNATEIGASNTTDGDDDSSADGVMMDTESQSDSTNDEGTVSSSSGDEGAAEPAVNDGDRGPPAHAASGNGPPEHAASANGGPPPHATVSASADED